MKKSFFHELDPRVKLLWMFVISGVAMYQVSLLNLGLFIITVFPVYLSAKRFGLLVKTTIKVFPFLLFLMVTQSIGIGIYNGFTIDYMVISRILGQIMKVYIMISASVLLFETTSYAEIALSIRSLKKNMHGRWNIFIEQVAFTLGTAYQFIPVLTKEIQTMVEVRRSRGDGITEGNGFIKAKKLIRMGIPLLNRTFELIKNLLLTLINYNYQPQKERSQIQVLTFQVKDIICFVILVSLAVSGIILR